jgi:hypothetical protein
MSKSRRKHKDLARAIEKIRKRAGDLRVRFGKRAQKGQPVQDSFARYYLD